MQKYSFQSPIGILCIEEENDSIVGLYMDGTASVNNGNPPTKLLQKAHAELLEYFEGQRKTFDLPIELEGTVFQVKVWEALQTIPYGTTCCYADIAKKIGNPKAVRAVGGANNKNHIIILVPCHRVIGKDGSLVGFGGGLPVKQFLLDLEQK